jgi:hypothetical protein
MENRTTVVKVYAELYRHVPDRLLLNKEGRYQELQELFYLIYHNDDTSPEQEAQQLIAALKIGGVLRPRYHEIVRQTTWEEINNGNFTDT